MKSAFGPATLRFPVNMGSFTVGLDVDQIRKGAAGKEGNGD